MVQLSHSYMTTGKTIALARWIFVNKVMSLIFNMLSTFVLASRRATDYQKTWDEPLSHIIIQILKDTAGKSMDKTRMWLNSE